MSHRPFPAWFRPWRRAAALIGSAALVLGLARGTAETRRSPDGALVLHAAPGARGTPEVRADFDRHPLLAGLTVQAEDGKPLPFTALQATTAPGALALLAPRAPSDAWRVGLSALDGALALRVGRHHDGAAAAPARARLLLHFPPDTRAWQADGGGKTALQPLRAIRLQNFTTLALALPTGEPALLLPAGGATLTRAPAEASDSVALAIADPGEPTGATLLIGRDPAELFQRHQQFVASTPAAPEAVRRASRAFFPGARPLYSRAGDVALALVDADAARVARARSAGQGTRDFADELWQRVPETWDETRVLSLAIVQHAAIARRSRAEWWIGVITVEANARYAVPLRFLEPGKVFVAHIAADDAGAPAAAARHLTRKVTAEDVLTLSLAPRSGAAIWITPEIKFR